MSRSIWKGPVFNESSLVKFISNVRYCSWDKLNKKRNLTIPQVLADKYIFVHSGANFKKVNINKERVGFKFGTCLKTRTYTRKILKNKKK